LVLITFGDVPTTGDEIAIGAGVFRVEKMRGRGITAVSLALTPTQVTILHQGEA
jgi:Mg2+/Co2+ transporter CorC